MAMGTKKCSKCGIKKDFDEFHNDRTRCNGKKYICKLCDKLQTETYRVKNKNKVLISQRKYYYENKGTVSETHAEYRKNNKEKIQIQSAKYYIDNKGKIRENHKKYNMTEAGKISAKKSLHKRRYLKNNSKDILNAEEWNIVLQLQGYKCIKCNNYFDKIDPTIDHIIPVTRGGNFNKTNVQALCGSCNSKKGIKTIDYRADNHKQIINQEIQNGS